ncbi:MAG: GntP family permease [Dechloromonas sp.]|nr:MAG: GntP family permease [Dechloromonas sp.]
MRCHLLGVPSHRPRSGGLRDAGYQGDRFRKGRRRCPARVLDANAMNTEGRLLLSILLGIGFIVLSTTRWRIHPFLSLLIASLGVGLGAGNTLSQVLVALVAGFGKTAGAIGIVITCGCIIGAALEKSGYAKVIAGLALRITGERRAVLAMSGTGAIVSIPVFCDSGFVILSPLAKSLAKSTGQAVTAFVVALAMGLYATHCLVPPTPGPIAAAAVLGANFGVVIGFGLVTAVFVVAATYWYACWIGTKVALVGPGEVTAVRAEEIGPTPSAALALFPILLPVILIGTKAWYDSSAGSVEPDRVANWLFMLGEPNMALLLGTLATWWVVRKHGAIAFSNWSQDGIRDAGSIILITAAGGAFGGVLRETPLGDLVGAVVGGTGFGALGLLVPFTVAAALKTTQGSSTVAMITTASLMAPLLGSLGLDCGYGPALATLAIASGAMMLSHVNDSFFWVVTQLSGMSVAQGYRAITVASGVAGLTAIAVVLVLSVLFL